MPNDLNELNTILFETLRGVNKGDVDTKQANAVIGLSNAVVNNAKVQIQAMKLSGKKTPPKMLSIQGTDRITGDKHKDMLTYAQELGFTSVAEAMAEISKDQFKKDFQSWSN